MKYLSPIPKQFVDQNGLPLSNGTVHVHISGDTQYANVYQDADGEELMPNPARLDSNGAWLGFVTAGVPLDYVVEDKDGNVQFEYEKVIAGSGTANVAINPVLSSGTKIAECWVDGELLELFAPEGGGGSQVQSNWAETDTSSPAYIQNKPSFSTVATTGNYNDLTGKPTIPAEQVNSDWTAQLGKAQILNKPITIPNTTGGLSKTLDSDDISNGYIEFKVFLDGSYTGPFGYTNPTFVLFGSISQLKYNSGSADSYIDTAEVGLYSEGIVGEYINYYEHSHAELLASSAKGWGASGQWSLSKNKLLSVYVRFNLTSSASAGAEVSCKFISGIFGSGLFT